MAGEQKARPNAFSVFSYNDEITVTRLGKSVSIRGRDGTTNSSDTVESNLLFEILKELRKKK